MAISIDQLLDDYNNITDASRNHVEAVETAARDRGRTLLKLRETGLSYAAIGVLVGLSGETVRKLAANAV